MNKIPLIVSVLFLFGNLLGDDVDPEKLRALEEQRLEEIEFKQQIDEYKREIDALKDDDNLYWGEGLSEINTERDLGEAKIISRKRAFEDLAQHIETRVQSDITEVITGKTIQSRGVLDDMEIAEITKMTKVYTDIVISNTSENFYIDYPRRGAVTSFVYISRDEYRENVEAALKQQKQIISDQVQNAEKEYRSSNFMLAIQHWARAREYQKDFFGELPLSLEISGYEEPVTLRTYIEGIVTNFFSRLKLELLTTENLIYDSQGRLPRRPIVYAYFLDESSDKKAVSNLPIAFSNLSGRADLVTSELMTSNYGQLEIPVRNIDAINRETIVNISIDKDKIPGKDYFTLPPMPVIMIEMSKMKTIALATTLMQGNTAIESDNIRSSIEGLLINHDFSVLLLEQDFMVMQDDVKINEAMNLNADYLLDIVSQSGKANKIGGYDNLFSLTCTTAIDLYELPSGMKIASDRISSQKGYGTSEENACIDAFSKIEESLIAKTKSIIENIK